MNVEQNLQQQQQAEAHKTKTSSTVIQTRNPQIILPKSLDYYGRVHFEQWLSYPTNMSRILFSCCQSWKSFRVKSDHI